MTANFDHKILKSQVQALQAFWRDAGLETAVQDEVVEWLADPVEHAPQQARSAQSSAKPEQANTQGAGDATDTAPRRDDRRRWGPQATSAGEATRFGGDANNWPTDLVAFQQWWSDNPALANIGLGARIAPAGSAQPDVMVILPDPCPDDRDGLVTGQSTRFFDAMLRACGLSRDQIYLASVLPAHDPVPDWPALQTTGAGELLSHHIGLVAPKRILALGHNILSLIDNEPAQARQSLRNVNHKHGSVPAMKSGTLGELERSASQRRRFWANWLEWNYSAQS